MLKQTEPGLTKSSDRCGYTFMFMGVTGSGITSTMSTLFNLPTEKPYHPFSFKVKEISDQFSNPPLNIIDSSGFCKSQFKEQDTALVKMLRSNLTVPPTVCFIVTRPDDIIGSNFQEMLKKLRSFKGEWTDASFSNVILVLTHSSNVTQNMHHQTIDKCQEAFYKVFPATNGTSINCLFVDNIHDIENSRNRLLLIK